MVTQRGPEILRLTVVGQPAGSGSKSPMPKGKMIGGRFRAVLDAVGRPVFYVKPSSEATEPWMKKVKAQAEDEWEGAPALDGALWLDACFYETRPAGHFLTGGRLNPKAPAYPHQTVTHDRDKMVRAVCDSLTNAKVIASDKRTIAGGAWKLYADVPPRLACAVIVLGRMRDQTVAEAGIESPPVQDPLL